MKAGSKALRVLERGLLLLELLLLVMFVFAHIHTFIMLRAEMATFEATQLESAKYAFAHPDHVLPILFCRPCSESLHRRSVFEVIGRAG